MPPALPPPPPAPRFADIRPAPADNPHPAIVGAYVEWKAMPSRHLALARDILVWLPPGYDAPENAAVRYPVLYLHDGRQVFDPATSTWGHDWRIDDEAQRLIPSGHCAPFIAVAADCTSDRDYEYSPGPGGDAYLRFLADELKPAVDRAFRTDPARSAICGASMGGLISLYALLRRPDLFEAAACLSPAFVAPWDAPIAALLDAPGAADLLAHVRVYLSCGGAGRLEPRLLPGTQAVSDRLLARGLPPSAHRLDLDPAADHNELAWSRLVPVFLPFLFPPVAPAAPRP